MLDAIATYFYFLYLLFSNFHVCQLIIYKGIFMYKYFIRFGAYYNCTKTINLLGGFIMKKNPSIGCTVSSCKYHANEENYCTLQQIMVGTHENCPTEVQCTDCESFEYKA